MNRQKKKKSTSTRSSRPELFCKKGILRNFEKFTGSTCARASFFNKVAGFGQNFKEICKFCEISKKSFSYRTPPVAASVVWNMFEFGAELSS